MRLDFIQICRKKICWKKNSESQKVRVNEKRGPTEIRTPVDWVKAKHTNHYTIGPLCFLLGKISNTKLPRFDPHVVRSRLAQMLPTRYADHSIVSNCIWTLQFTDLRKLYSKFQRLSSFPFLPLSLGELSLLSTSLCLSC